MGRWLAVFGVQLCEIGLGLQHSADLDQFGAQLVALVTPAPAQGRLTERARPDLCGNNPDPAPVFRSPAPTPAPT